MHCSLSQCDNWHNCGSIWITNMMLVRFSSCFPLGSFLTRMVILWVVHQQPSQGTWLHLVARQTISNYMLINQVVVTFCQFSCIHIPKLATGHVLQSAAMSLAYALVFLNSTSAQLLYCSLDVMIAQNLCKNHTNKLIGCTLLPYQCFLQTLPSYCCYDVCDIFLVRVFC